MTTLEPRRDQMSPASDAAVGALVMQLIATASGSTTNALLGREVKAARGRQLAFYVMHVGLGWSLDRIGRLFSRQRSTVSHACRQVEDRRERTEIDRAIARLQDVVREAVALRLEL